MNSSRFLSPPLRLFQGPDCLDHLASELQRHACKRPMVISGNTLGSDPGVARLMCGALANGDPLWFRGVRSHSPSTNVLQAARYIHDSGADALVALGGGSAVVTARAAAIVAAEGRDLEQLCTRAEHGHHPVSPRLLEPKLPIFVVPSTPTTAMVKAGSAVLDEKSGTRMALFDPKTRAAALFLHPLLLSSAPPGQVMGAALNTLSMAVEGLESATSTALSDAPLLQALRLAWRGIERLGAAPDDLMNRIDLMLAAVLCGQGTDHAGGGLTSVLSHAIGARLGVSNGLTNAVLLPHTVLFNGVETGPRLPAVAHILRAEDESASLAAACSKALAERFVALGVPQRLRDAGVPLALLETLADDASRDWFLQQAPRPANASALMTLLEQSW